ncbi:TonB family protein [Jinshanibacter sp. LJY008]|uniref:Protein TonB n=1 Tax=Limnobaculum eriocheiris TaxID=2897391 RepID=A0A9X1MWJ4_9GAMM|nr:TonB family protein [Limnobaculum eriocheiris]MCD1126077.1 TonB family protein [Limnobaculum eriocheiris]
MKKFFLARRFSWPLTFSVCLHTSLIGGLVFASIKDQIEIPAPDDSAPMNVVMVNPAMFATPAEVAEQSSPAQQPMPAPEPEPEEAKPEPIPEPPPVEKPKSVEIEKPKPKPVEEPKKQPKKGPKPKREPVKERAEQAPVEKPATAPITTTNTSTVASGPVASVSGAAPATGSKILKQVEPAYPKQAFDRRIEGQVEIMFDIDEDGRIENVRILSATPPRMFDRDVRAALKKWRYTPVVVKDKKLTIIFKIDGGAQIR